uniref:Uncharacterized protein n=1 Tax=Timema monikensis TaxID=170555 RepID=A0A7R9DZ54_9NEOP|nr:unnamed protein product [Timema monikensis]
MSPNYRASHCPTNITHQTLLPCYLVLTAITSIAISCESSTKEDNKDKCSHSDSEQNQKQGDTKKTGEHQQLKNTTYPSFSYEYYRPRPLLHKQACYYHNQVSYLPRRSSSWYQNDEHYPYQPFASEDLDSTEYDGSDDEYELKTYFPNDYNQRRANIYPPADDYIDHAIAVEHYKGRKYYLNPKEMKHPPPSFKDKKEVSSSDPRLFGVEQRTCRLWGDGGREKRDGSLTTFKPNIHIEGVDHRLPSRHINVAGAFKRTSICALFRSVTSLALPIFITLKSSYNCEKTELQTTSGSHPQTTCDNHCYSVCIMASEEDILLSALKVYPHFRGGRVENYSGKIILSTPDRDSNHYLPIIGSLVCCESSALDHVTIKGGDVAILKTLPMVFVTQYGRSILAVCRSGALAVPFKRRKPPALTILLNTWLAVCSSAVLQDVKSKSSPPPIHPTDAPPEPMRLWSSFPVRLDLYAIDKPGKTRLAPLTTCLTDAEITSPSKKKKNPTVRRTCVVEMTSDGIYYTLDEDGGYSKLLEETEQTSVSHRCGSQRILKASTHFNKLPFIHQRKLSVNKTQPRDSPLPPLIHPSVIAISILTSLNKPDPNCVLLPVRRPLNHCWDAPIRASLPHSACHDARPDVTALPHPSLSTLPLTLPLSAE